jgi:hypothetical protein
MLVLAVIYLVVLHSVDGHEVTVNRDLVTSLTAAKDDTPNKLFVDSVRCVIGLNDGKIVTVAESCDAVRKLLEGK